ncbi:hypothetical protein TNCV_2857901 [Trichonephila clavipes]|nr:hypothetical protein TNCV_2857901 [Trichonephila clavipes]
MEGDSGRGELVISAVLEKFKSKFVQADEKLVCYWSSGVGERELYSLRLVSSMKLGIRIGNLSGCLCGRGNVSPFARVCPQRLGKKDAFHRIPFLVNRANVKTAIITLGTGDLPSYGTEVRRGVPAQLSSSSLDRGSK